MSVYDSIIKGLNEAVGYEKGNVKAKKKICTVAALPSLCPKEIKVIRTDLKMTQATFAAVLGVSPKTVEAWEAGTNAPIGSSRRLLGMLKSDKSLLEKCNLISFGT